MSFATFAVSPELASAVCLFQFFISALSFATFAVSPQMTSAVCLFQFFISALSFATFAVSPELPQNRLQLSFTLLLTSVAFKFVINQSLPKISYLTYMVSTCFTSMASVW